MISSLLVVCTGNICRSPMAAALLAERARVNHREMDIASAGIAALVGYPPPREAIELMAKRGLDISGHRARQITAELARAYDMILVMELGQQRFIEGNWPMLRGRVRRLGERRGEDVTDPYRCAEAVYRASLVEIEAGVEEWSSLLL